MCDTEKSEHQVAKECAEQMLEKLYKYGLGDNEALAIEYFLDLYIAKIETDKQDADTLREKAMEKDAAFIRVIGNFS